MLWSTKWWSTMGHHVVDQMWSTTRSTAVGHGRPWPTTRSTTNSSPFDRVIGRARQRQDGVYEPRVPASSAPGAGLKTLPPILDESEFVPVEAEDTGGAEPSGAGARAESSGARRGPLPDTKKEIGIQSDDGPAWTQWELGKALRGLRSDNRVVRCRTLRQIHSRLWHCPAKRLVDLLRQACNPQHVLAEVQNVVDTCRSCRDWQRRTAKPMVSLTITTQFNEGLQYSFWVTLLWRT